MPRGYRCVILAAFGWLILAGASEHHDQQGAKAGDGREAHQAIAATPAIKPSDRTKGSSRDDGRCEGAYHEEKTCNAITANAAVDQAGYAYWQTVAAWLGVAVGVGTLIAAILAARWAKKAAIHTGRGVTEARRAADAADTQASIALHTALAMERPYIFVNIDADDVRISIELQLREIAQIPLESKHHAPIEVNYTIKNHGSTPAIINMISATLFIAPDIPPDFRFHPDRFIDADFILDAGKPLSETVTSTLNYSCETVSAIMGGECSPFLIGKIEYTNVAGREFGTWFCWRYHPAEGKRQSYISQAGYDQWNRRT